MKTKLECRLTSKDSPLQMKSGMFPMVEVSRTSDGAERGDPKEEWLSFVEPSSE